MYNSEKASLINNTIKPLIKQGWYFAQSPSGVCKYFCDPEGRKAVIAFSDSDRLEQIKILMR